MLSIFFSIELSFNICFAVLFVTVQHAVFCEPLIMFSITSYLCIYIHITIVTIVCHFEGL